MAATAPQRALRLPPTAAGGAAGEAARTFELVAVHSLTWLFLGNAVGLLLATLLLFPRLGRLLEPFSYGRWMPVHLDLQLYGWCALPLVGLLLRLYLPASGGGRWPRLAVGAWSGSLLVGAISWLAGRSSGKLFLDWSGPARAAMAASLGVLWLVLAISYGRRLAELRRGGPPGRAERWAEGARGAFLAALAPVPYILYWAAGPGVYPPINPDSGGATGGSLLGSTLGVVAIVYLCPLVFGWRSDDGGRTAARTAALLGLHFVAFAVLDHGDRSHHEIPQILSLASLGIWWPLLARHLRRFVWTAAGRRWLAALAVWGAMLYIDGFLSFLPRILEHLKFTNALVAHAHIAMAGMATSFAVLVLQALGRRTALRRIFARRGPFLLWHAGCLTLATSLLLLGALEGASPGLLFGRGLAADALYAGRWLGGAMMLVASGRWLGAALAGWGRVERRASAAPAIREMACAA